jgi:predicted TPR repeat methyltransferase
MNPRPTASLTSAYFDRKYAEKLDYWNFETSEYERAKYAHTLQALPRPHYRSIFEIGCSIGVLTALLFQRTDRLLAIDVSEKALAAAQKRCPLANVKLMHFPREYPVGELFDLIVVSEVAYYWSQPELDLAQKTILDLLELNGNLVLVHWTPEDTDYPLTGDAVHDSFSKLDGLSHVLGHKKATYRLDAFRRLSVP